MESLEGGYHLNEVNGFLKAEGQKLINGQGQEILLRGVGLGGWLLPEGYMWCLPGQWDRPRRIERMIEGLIGIEKAEHFWDLYYERYTSEEDIRQIAAEGFNSVRVPFNARHIIQQNGSSAYNERYMQLMDRVIKWCRKYGLYVILDMHGAPGGQTGANIDDSENDRPDLFTVEKNRRLTVELWRMLALRYKDEWIVAGYDLLNEPLPDWFSVYNTEVLPLYREITKAIREVDGHHMIILEGVHWATDWSIFNEKFDDNLLLQFHKYWNNPDTESIRIYLDKREELNVPIFMGEGGENNKEWYTGAFRLFEDHDVSWNFWTWKKMDTDNSPCSVNMPAQWQQLADYVEGSARPNEDRMECILWGFLENISFDRCTYHPEVVRSIFRRTPVRIPAVFYGFKGEGKGFGLTKRFDGSIGFRRDDGIEIRFTEGTRVMPNFKHMSGETWQEDEYLCIYLTAGDWVCYEFAVGKLYCSLPFKIHLHMCSQDNGGRITISVDGVQIGSARSGGQSWETVCLKEEIRLGRGQHTITLKAEGRQVGIKWLEVEGEFVDKSD